jgi:undecaprenyl-diphosphatase
MTLLYLILLALIQGLTEFLPISSSGHLILLPRLTGMQDQGQVLDVAVHIGSLFAVILYFRADVKIALAGLAQLCRGNRHTKSAALAMHLIISTVPVCIFGLLIKLAGWEDMLRSITVIGWTMLIFGLVLYWADRTGETTKTSEDWSLKDAIYMGLTQAIALIPGTSRSGITITTARKLGYARQDAARLSMLMSIPTIIASGVLIGTEALAMADSATLILGAIAAALSFVAALLALTLMMRLLRSVSFTPYVIYRVVLGVFLLSIAYS